MGSSDILNGNADRFVERDFALVRSPRLGSSEYFADFRVNRARRDASFLDCKQDISALSHNRRARIDDHFGAGQGHAIEFPEVRPVGPDSINVSPGFEPVSFDDRCFGGGHGNDKIGIADGLLSAAHNFDGRVNASSHLFLKLRSTEARRAMDLERANVSY